MIVRFLGLNNSGGWHDLVEGEDYVVFEINAGGGSRSFLVAGRDAEYPVPHPASWFEVVDARIPPDWSFDGAFSGPQVSPAWVSEGYFLEALVGGDQRAVDRFRRLESELIEWHQERARGCHPTLSCEPYVLPDEVARVPAPLTLLPMRSARVLAVAPIAHRVRQHWLLRGMLPSAVDDRPLRSKVAVAAAQEYYAFLRLAGLPERDDDGLSFWGPRQVRAVAPGTPCILIADYFGSTGDTAFGRTDRMRARCLSC
jgi:hypothetical protein